MRCVEDGWKMEKNWCGEKMGGENLTYQSGIFGYLGFIFGRVGVRLGLLFFKHV